jgi:elongation factor P
MIATGDFKRGLRVLVDGQPYTIDEHTVQTPSARGAATLVKVRLRHVVTGQVTDRTFKAGERFEEPDVALRNAQFLYRDGDGCHFMDLTTYDQTISSRSPPRRSAKASTGCSRTWRSRWCSTTATRWV